MLSWRAVTWQLTLHDSSNSGWKVEALQTQFDEVAGQHVQLLLLLLTPPADRVRDWWHVGKGVEVGRATRGNMQRGGVAGRKQGREGTGLEGLSAYIRLSLHAAPRCWRSLLPIG